MTQSAENGLPRPADCDCGHRECPGAINGECPHPSAENVAGHYCGQTQPHAAHTWQTPPIYGQATFISTYQCAGLTCVTSPEEGQ